ncbi:hypothetical protein Btru_037415 [Bulinus truncatus]|nr:hypothetical protein Btru_037415 [Bulinus truncatus]
MIGRAPRLMTSLVCALLCVTPQSRAKYDFEGADDEEWKTLREDDFRKVQAASEMQLPGRPATDTTLQSPEGHYGYASSEGRAEHEGYSTLMNNCLPPSGPRCQLRFNAVIGNGAKLDVATKLKCNCTSSVQETFYFQQGINSTAAAAGVGRRQAPGVLRFSALGDYDLRDNMPWGRARGGVDVTHDVNESLFFSC